MVHFLKHLKDGMSRSVVWQAIFRSHEAGASSNPEGRGEVNNQERSDLIIQFYETILLRTPSANEISHWLDHLKRGLSITGLWQRIYNSSEAQKLRERRGRGEVRSKWSDLITQFYETILLRTPSADEISHWLDHLKRGLSTTGLWQAIYNSSEAKRSRDLISRLSIAELIVSGYQLILGSGASARNIARWRALFNTGKITEEKFVAQLFRQSLNEREHYAAIADGRHKITGSPIVGGQFITSEEWQKRLQLALKADFVISPSSHATFAIKADRKEIRVSVIASLYRGGRYIRKYLENITSQTIFGDFCELIIVDANSPENESSIIQEYVTRFPNIVYVGLPYRASIYTAWNIAVKMARGVYITNANLDDIRRIDSLEIQCGVLDTLPFIDITYQDVFYTLDPDLPLRHNPED